MEQGTSCSGPLHGFTLVELLAVIAIIGTLVGLLLPAVQVARESGRRSACINNMKQLGLGVQTYIDVKRRLPPGAGQPELPAGVRLGYGYLFGVVPYIELQGLYDKIYTDVITNSTTAPNNSYSQTRNCGDISTFRCPSDPASAAFRLNNSSRPAMQPLNYSANWGDVLLGHNSVHTGGYQMRGPFVNCHSTFGGATYSVPVKLAHITDGLSKTLLLGEVGVVGNAANSTFGLKASVANWTGNGTSNMASPAAPSSCLNASSWVTPTTDILTWAYGHGMGWLRAEPAYTGFFTILPPNSPPCASGTSIDGTTLGTISSKHPGGACVVMCDSSVRFIADTIDCGDLTVTPTLGPGSNSKQYAGQSQWGVWGAMGTISRGETAQVPE
jgi:prepilin-type N-terminal cleavage/methylation domain-containing protein